MVFTLNEEFLTNFKFFAVPANRDRGICFIILIFALKTQKNKH